MLLKNTLSFKEESKSGTLNGKVNLLGDTNTSVFAVCAAPTIPLNTRTTFLLGYVPKTDKVSVPIPKVLPTEIEFTTLFTKMSVTKPTVELASNSTDNRVLSDETPIL